MNLDDLETAVFEWSKDRGIYEHSSIQAQTLKAVAEMGELADNVIKGKDVQDDIGDIIVCLINVAAFAQSDITTCLQLAYDDIKDRTGHMVPGGAFVKD